MELLIIGGEILFAAAIFTVAGPSVPAFLASAWIAVSLGFAVNVNIPRPIKIDPASKIYKLKIVQADTVDIIIPAKKEK